MIKIIVGFVFGLALSVIAGDRIASVAPAVVVVSRVSHIHDFTGDSKLVAGDIIAVTKNGIETCRYTVPAGKTAEIEVDILGTEK